MLEKLKKIGNIGTLIFIFCGIVIALFFLISINITIKNIDKEKQKEQQNITDAKKFKIEHEELNGTYLDMEINEDNIITYATYRKINDILDGGTGVIYFGWSDSQDSRQAIPLLFQAAENTGITKIYYLDLKKDRNELKIENDKITAIKEGSHEYNNLVKRLSDYLLGYKEISHLYKRIYAPTVLFVKNGNVVGSQSKTLEGVMEGELLNKEQRKELYQIYLSNMEKVSENLCNADC